MKKKLIVSAISIGIFILLTIVITSVILMYKNSSDVSNVFQGSKDKQGYQEDLVVIENLFNDGNLDEAIARAKSIFEDNSNDIDVLVVYATCLLQKGSITFDEEIYGKKGLVVAEKIIKLAPQSEKGYFVKGYAYEIMEEHSKAIEAYQKYLGIKKDADILNRIGHVYDLMGDNDKAEEFYVKALELDKNSLVARMNIGRIRYGNKEYKESLGNFKVVFANAKNNLLKAEAAYMIGQVYMLSENKDLNKAEWYMDQASVIDNSYPLAWVGVGQAAFIKGVEDESTDFISQMEKAVNSFDKAIVLNPNQTMAYLFKARLYVFTGNKDIAEEEYNKALDTVNRDIVLMHDDKESVERDILEEMKMYNFVAKKSSFINTVIKSSLFGLTKVYALEFHYDTREEAMEAIDEHNAGTSPGAGHWIDSNGVCENGVNITWGPPPPPPCIPHGCGACSATCGPGTCFNGCYDENCSNGPCPSCKTPAHRESYERTSNVDSGRCLPGAVSAWADNSGLASNNGIAWTWKCSKTNVTVDCVAYKKGECEDEPSDPPYNTRAEACMFGAFNSIHLTPDGDLKWQCGTGETGKYLGSFSENTPNVGGNVTVDYYGPKEGGVECSCTPVYDYTCVTTGAFEDSCVNRCGESIIEIYQAYKKDTTCFINEPKVAINKDEYFAGAGEHCVNESVQCAPCGIQDSEGGDYHETN